MDVEAVVIGGGVVGLACARALAHQRRAPWLLEREPRCGEGISSRNSGVIHAGMYYPRESWKARLCVAGRRLLYRYCAERGIAHRRTGKWIIAVAASELPHLQAIFARGLANGVSGLRWLHGDELRARQPELSALAAIESPLTGIVDVPELVLALVGEVESEGGRVLTGMAVERIDVLRNGFRITLDDGAELCTRRLVNACGLGAQDVAMRTRGLDSRHVPKLYFAAGHYYALRGKAPFQQLIYPVPEAGGLGVHLVLDLAGRAGFGPDVRWRETVTYDFDDSQRAAFAASIRRWWPTLRDDQLQPNFVGIRPKLAGPGEANADFRIDDGRVHGVTGLINLFGIESPGLTAALAIGEEVARRLE